MCTSSRSVISCEICGTVAYTVYENPYGIKQNFFIIINLIIDLQVQVKQLLVFVHMIGDTSLLSCRMIKTFKKVKLIKIS